VQSSRLGRCWLGLFSAWCLSWVVVQQHKQNVSGGCDNVTNERLKILIKALARATSSASLSSAITEMLHCRGCQINCNPSCGIACSSHSKLQRHQQTDYMMPPGGTRTPATHCFVPSVPLVLLLSDIILALGVLHCAVPSGAVSEAQSDGLPVNRRLLMNSWTSTAAPGTGGGGQRGHSSSSSSSSTQCISTGILQQCPIRLSEQVLQVI